MTPTPTDTPPEAAALDEVQLRLQWALGALRGIRGLGSDPTATALAQAGIDLALADDEALRAAGNDEALESLAEVRAARQHAEPQGNPSGGDGAGARIARKLAFLSEPQGSRAAWPQEARDAVAALEERYDISVVSLEHHREWVDRCERLETQGSRAGGAPDAELRAALERERRERRKGTRTSHEEVVRLSEMTDAALAALSTSSREQDAGGANYGDLIKRLREVVPYQGRSNVAFLCHEAAAALSRTSRPDQEAGRAGEVLDRADVALYRAAKINAERLGYIDVGAALTALAALRTSEEGAGRG